MANNKGMEANEAITTTLPNWPRKQKRAPRNRDVFMTRISSSLLFRVACLFSRYPAHPNPYKTSSPFFALFNQVLIFCDVPLGPLESEARVSRDPVRHQRVGLQRPQEDDRGAAGNDGRREEDRLQGEETYALAYFTVCLMITNPYRPFPNTTV